MSGAPDARPLSSHDRILLAARQLFARQGYQQTTTAQVARLAATSESQLIKHFGSKEGLLESIFEAVWTEVNVQVAKLVDRHRQPAERLKALTTLMLRRFDDDPELKTLFLLEGRRIRKGGVSVTAGFQQFVKGLDALLADAKRQGLLRHRLSPAAIRALLIGAFEGMLRDQMLAATGNYPAGFSTRDVQRGLDLLVDTFIMDETDSSPPTAKGGKG